jgi:hypothetical protein
MPANATRENRNAHNQVLAGSSARAEPAFTPVRMEIFDSFPYPERSLNPETVRWLLHHSLSITEMLK